MKNWIVICGALALVNCSPSSDRRAPVDTDTVTPVSQDVIVAPDITGRDAVTGAPDVEGADSPPPQGDTEAAPDMGQPAEVGDGSDAEQAPDVGPPPTDITGGVLIVQIDSSQLQSGTVSTFFRVGPAPEPAPVAVEGPCQVVFSDGAPTSSDGAPGLDAGKISVVGLIQPLEMTPTQSPVEGWVYDSGLADDLPNVIGGFAMVTATAEGGSQVPAFSASVPVPQQVSILAPTGDIDKDMDLTVAWNPTGADFTRIDLFVVDGGSGEQKAGNTVSCTLDGDPGTYVVPKNIVQQLPGGGGSFSLDVLVVGVSRINVSEVQLDGGVGTVNLAITRSGGGGGAFKD